MTEKHKPNTAPKLKIAALIVAGGMGERLPGNLPKQYRPLAGVPILRRTVEIFVSHPDITIVMPVINPDNRTLYDKALKRLNLPEPAMRGDTRQESVRSGLESLRAYAPDYVLIHDAARPFVTHALIDRLIESVKQHDAVIPVLPLTDTLKRITDNVVEQTVSRDNMFRVQTPQAFSYPLIMEAHKKALYASFTDDSRLLETQGQNVYTVTGDINNIKITTMEDLEKADLMVASEIMYETRMGMGFDVHQFCDPKHDAEQNHIMLCGVAVQHGRSLKGHSDADVGLHALVDALLGAIAAGDIGQHFPPSDPQWKDGDSAQFVTHAAGLVKEKNATIVNVDITIIGERPKVSNYRDAMQQRVAELLQISPDRVSIKATTTEKLGFTGRQEGLAAQAVASIKLPAKENA